ncbi:2Fe-2S iron-sulfur cluster-binding protein [Haloplanus ruber]|uniref:2Fe-2S iron-sulfur cluster-binding protein n=1 Tax=Haloplanus ruber TaxID=869892 RepID=A0ABD6CY45_9EURY|nr:2Fe-2S iron-sulfur cluster-binding protein [Haloplanus ruber]
MSCEVVYVEVVDTDGTEDLIVAPAGTTLRAALLDADHSPYTRLTESANCGGRGLCATCGVRIEAGTAPPTDWHDKLASQWGYPRLSCRIQLDEDLRVRVPEKRIWGRRERADG